MNLREARKAIADILSSIPDDQLPKPTKFENREYKLLAWFGPTGHHLGKATNNGFRNPLVIREFGIDHAIEQEAVCRLDQILFDNCDDPFIARLIQKTNKAAS